MPKIRTHIAIKHLLQTLLLLTIFCSVKVFAGLDNIRFQRLTLEQGLSQETITSIFQDSQGFMWFGTQEGLNRFDGYQFKVFAHDDRVKSSLSSDWVVAIDEDYKQDLWVGTSNKGVNIFNKATGQFRTLLHNPGDANSLNSNRILSLYNDSTGTMWVGTERGLNRYDAANDKFIQVPLLQANHVGSHPKVGIKDITESKNGVIWIATNKGAFSYDIATKQVKPITDYLIDGVQLASQNTMTLLMQDQSTLWLGYYDYGVDVIDLETGELKHFEHDQNDPSSLSNNLVRDIFEDEQGNIWLATDQGLNLFDEDSDSFSSYFHEVENPYSLGGNKLTKIYQDNGGVFWVGTYSGLSKWNTSTANFNHYRVKSDKKKSLSDNGVNAIYQDSKGSVWIGTYGGLNRLDLKTGNVKQFKHSADDSNSLSSDRVMSLYVDDRDRVWVGTQNKGMDLYNPETGNFKNYSSSKTSTNSISSNGVTSIAPSNDGKLWISTYGGGLNLFDPNTERFSHFKHDPNSENSISSNRILSVYQDENGLVWLATLSGLSLFNPITESTIRIKHDPNNPMSLGSDVVISVYEDSKQNIWIGTSGGGLNKLDAQNRVNGNYVFERISRHEGLPSNVIYGVLEDEMGMIWISSNRGLTKYDPETKALINYDSSHGLQGNEFNGGAFFKAKDGQFFFGGTNGVTAFYPEVIQPNSHVPPVVLTNFLRLNESYSPNEEVKAAGSIQIDYQDYLIAFEFAGLDYASPSNNRYSYKLEGFDEDWIEAGELRRATYTNLPAGDYVFRVKASNNDGVWNEQGTDLAVTVLPAPWRSWWAYTIYTLIGFIGLALIARSHYNKLQKEARYRAKLEQEVKNRTSELREVNEQLLNASVTDQLTGLHNRRYLSNIIDHECAQVLREVENLNSSNLGASADGPRLFCLMFDLDGFKPINDTYGHDAGDQIICQVSDLLRNVCRKADTVIRWGGDEFLVVGRVERLDEVDILAERLRNAIVSKGFDIGLKQRLHLSCSIGYGLYPFAPQYPDSLSWEQVQMIADRALYYSKDAGRNHWTGIVATDSKPPVSLMNQLSNNLEQVVEEGYVTIKQAINVEKREIRLRDSTSKVS